MTFTLIEYGAPSVRWLTKATAYEYRPSTTGVMGRFQTCNSTNLNDKSRRDAQYGQLYWQYAWIVWSSDGDNDRLRPFCLFRWFRPSKTFNCRASIVNDNRVAGRVTVALYKVHCVVDDKFNWKLKRIPELPRFYFCTKFLGLGCQVDLDSLREPPCWKCDN